MPISIDNIILVLIFMTILLTGSTAIVLYFLYYVREKLEDLEAKLDDLYKYTESLDNRISINSRALDLQSIQLDKTRELINSMNSLILMNKIFTTVKDIIISEKDLI